MKKNQCYRCYVTILIFNLEKMKKNSIISKIEKKIKYF